jgi:hypothetical protein
MNGLGDMFSVGSGWVARAIESLPREESMGAGDRQLTTLALLLLAGAGTGEAAAQNPSGAIAPPTSSPLHFSGSVLITGLPADPGAVVQVVVFRTGMSYKVGADANVEVQTSGLTRPPPAPTTTGYDGFLEGTPECRNPDNTYDFYVNGVYANAARKYPFSPAVTLL